MIEFKRGYSIQSPASSDGGAQPINNESGIIMSTQEAQRATLNIGSVTIQTEEVSN